MSQQAHGKRRNCEKEPPSSPPPKKAEKPFALSKLSDIVDGSERNKINGTLISVSEPKTQYDLVICVLKLQDAYVKVRSWQQNSRRVVDELKNAAYRHVSFRIMAAQLEDEKFVDRKYGRLMQLNFGKSSEVKVIVDDLKMEPDEHEGEARAKKGNAKQVMLQDVVDGKAEGYLGVQLLAKTAILPLPKQEDAGDGPRYGSAVTDGFHKAEVFFRFPNAKHFLPPEVFLIHEFEADLVGGCLKINVATRSGIEKQLSSKPLNADADEDDYDFPVFGGETESEATASASEAKGGVKKARKEKPRRRIVIEDSEEEDEPSTSAAIAPPPVEDPQMGRRGTLEGEWPVERVEAMRIAQNGEVFWWIKWLRFPRRA